MALVIGIVGIVVMMQVFSVFEGQKRTTTGGDDAISSGAIALYTMQRDIQQSGWGISSLQLIGCRVTLPVGASIPLMPVTINPAGITGQDVNTDTLLVVSGSGNGTVEGDNIDSMPAAGAPNVYAVHTPTGFNPPQAAVPPLPQLAADWVVAAPPLRPSPCNLTLTDVTNVSAPNVAVSMGVAGMTNGKLYNLGSSPRVRVYAIRSGHLTVCNYWVNDCGLVANNIDSEIWVPMASNIVSLRAEYGRDTNSASMDAVVDLWDQTVATPDTPISGNAGKNIEACGRLRISALRIALVARSSVPEKAPGGIHVTAAAPVWAGSDDLAQGISATAAAAVAISPPSPDATWPTWQDFRYKVFQTVVPLRNITVMGAVTGC